MGIRIAVFGQAPFGRDVTLRLHEAGHQIVGVYVPPDKGRPDALAEAAEQHGLPLFRHPRFRRKGQAIPELVEEYLKLEADLNVLPFTTVILPPEIVDAPRLRSLCFHPSLLPLYRGGTAIPWQIILGARETGVTVFQPDEGVDTGPIVVQRGGVEIGDTDTAASLYYDKLYALGVEAMLEAVEAVASGGAELRKQDDSQASFQPRLDDESAQIDWERSAEELGCLIRGCDPQPGAHTLRGQEKLRLYGARLLPADAEGEPGTVLALENDSLVIAVKGGRLAIAKAKLGDGKKLPAPEVGIAPGERLG